jgi:hypothetical protein
METNNNEIKQNGLNDQSFAEPELKILNFTGAPITADSSRCCGWYGSVSHAD